VRLRFVTIRRYGSCYVGGAEQWVTGSSLPFRGSKPAVEKLDRKRFPQLVHYAILVNPALATVPESLEHQLQLPG
jgi:hypothetical protein